MRKPDLHLLNSIKEKAGTKLRKCFAPENRVFHGRDNRKTSAELEAAMEKLPPADPESGGAYVAFPWDIRAEFGKGRLKVHAEMDGIPYDGSIVNMGVRNEDGSICYVIGVLKAIRNRLRKGEGDAIHVVITAEGAKNHDAK